MGAKAWGNTGDNRIRSKWRSALSQNKFRITAGSFLLVLVVIVAALPAFFSFIEHRHGFVLKDPLLALIPAMDVSVWLFATIWSVILLALFRAWQDPDFFLQLLIAFVILTAIRIGSLYLVPLESPAGLIILKDPLSNYFYGNQSFITKDLFFSGHTATITIIYLCLKNKWDRFFAMLGIVLTGMLVLFQHAHFTIDVLAAPLFAWLAYKMSRILTSKFA